MAIRGGEIISYLELDKSKYSAGMRAARQEAQVFAQDGATMGRKFQGALNILGGFGRMATTGITVPVAGAFAAAGKAAIGFESAFAGVRKTVDATEREYAGLSKTILEMSRAVPRSAEALAGIMEAGGQLGVSKENLASFTRTIADLAVATNLTEEAGASMLAQYANVMGMDIGNIDRLGSVIVDLGNNTATTELDIVSMAQRLSGAGNILNLTNAQVMGLAATMSSLGINAEAGGSAMSRILQKMMRAAKDGGDELKTYAQTAGMTAEAFAAGFGEDPLAMLVSFIAGLNEINEAGGNVYDTLDELDLSDIRITDSILRMAGAQGALETNIQRANKAWEENSALTKEAQQRYGTAESRIQLAKNSITEAGISIGNAFLPIIGQAADGVANLANQFADLDEGTKNSILTGAGIAAAAGPAALAIKGIIGLFTGPGGVVAAAGLGVIALAAFFAEGKKQHDTDVLKRTKELFGEIELSASEIQKIIEKGYGTPTIDTTQLDNARKDVVEARAEFDGLNTDLASKIYLLSLGVDKSELSTLETDVATLISSAETTINANKRAITVNTGILFKEDPEGQSFMAQLNTHFAGLEGELEAKGKALSDLIKKGIADGKLSDEDLEIANKLRMEIQGIMDKATMINLQSEQDVIVSKYKRMPFTEETVKALIDEAKAFEERQRQAAKQVLDSNLLANAQLKNSGQITQAEYEARDAQIHYAYGKNLDADITKRTVTMLWDAVGQGLYDAAEQDIQKAADWLQQGRGKTTAQMLEEDPKALAAYWEKLGDLQLSADAIRPSVEKMGFLIDMLKGAQEIMGSAFPPELQAMLGKLEALKAFSEMDFEKIPADFGQNQEAQEAGKQDGEAYRAARDQAISEGDAVEPPKIDQGAVNQDFQNSGQEAAKTFESAVQDEEVHYKDVFVSPISGVPGEFGSIAGNAVSAFVGSVLAGTGRAYAAGRALAAATERGAKTSLKIASPSRVMLAIGLNVVRTYADTIKAGIPKVIDAAKRLGQATAGAGGAAADPQQSYQNGFIAGMQKEASDAPQTPGYRVAGGGLPKVTPAVRKQIDAANKKKKAKKRSSGGGYAALSSAWDTPAPMLPGDPQFDARMAAYEAQRERMLLLAGSWRAYYDDSAYDRAVKAIEDKYDALIGGQTEGTETLREEQRKELDALKKNYELQKKLATDWIDTQGALLQEEYARKQEIYRASDYDKAVAEMEKRVRQTRSARERRELTEELERMRRDEAMRLEGAKLQETLAGMGALKQAVNAGVIGLGELTQDRLLPSVAFGAGLRQVQGITADQLQSVLDAMQGGARMSGNHYTIDLSGAVIRSEDDIYRIADAFEQKQRSILRDLA